MKVRNVLILLLAVLCSLSTAAQQNAPATSQTGAKSKTASGTKKVVQDTKADENKPATSPAPAQEAKNTPPAIAKPPDQPAAQHEDVSVLARRLSTAIFVTVILAIVLGVLLIILLVKSSGSLTAQQMQNQLAALARTADVTQATQQLLGAVNALPTAAALAQATQQLQQALNALPAAAPFTQALQTAVNPLSARTDVLQARDQLLQSYLQGQQLLAQSLLEARNALQQTLAQLAQSLLETRSALQDAIQAHSPHS